MSATCNEVNFVTGIKSYTYYSVKGSTTDVTTCQVCGREDLRKTVVLHQFYREDHSFIGPVYAGTDCAATITGSPEHEMKQRVRNANRANRGQVKA